MVIAVLTVPVVLAEVGLTMLLKVSAVTVKDDKVSIEYVFTYELIVNVEEGAPVGGF